MICLCALCLFFYFLLIKIVRRKLTEQIVSFPLGVIGSETVVFASKPVLLVGDVIRCAGNDDGRSNCSSSHDVSDACFRFGGVG